MSVGEYSSEAARILNLANLGLKASATGSGTLVIKLESQQSNNSGAATGAERTLTFVLAKAGWDTISIVREMSRVLRAAPGSLHYAGVKDKTAITEQRLSSVGISPRRLLGLNHRPDLGGLRVGDLRYAPGGPVRVGALAGNRFTLLVRHLDVSPRRARRAARALRRHGFVNYFGHQRFGDGGASGLQAVEAGLALLRGEWDAVVSMAMDPGRAVSDREREAKQAWAEGRRAEALRQLPPGCADERALARALLNGLPAREACRGLPHRTMFMCAYWSRVWNLAASARLRRAGRAPVPGDLVRCTAADADGAGGVRTVTEEDAAAGRYGLWDVVLPLPGKGVDMPWPGPGTGAAEAMREALRRDGLLHAVCNPRGPAAPAVLRPLVLRPARLSFKTLRYDGPADLVAAVAGQGGGEDEGGGGGGQVSWFSGGGRRGRWAALQLRFGLPPNAYATMLLRELTRQDPRTATQYRARRAAEALERAAAGEGAGGEPGGEEGWEPGADGGRSPERGGEVWRRAARRIRRRGHVPDWRLGLADAAARMRRRPGARPAPRAGEQVAELVRGGWETGGADLAPLGPHPAGLCL